MSRMDNQQVTEPELAWLAGIIDGEGYLGLCFSNKNVNMTSVRPDIQIVNTDIELVDKVIDIYKKMGINPYIRAKKHNIKKNPQWKVAWNVQLSKFSDLSILLPRIIKYLTGIKKQKAQIIQDFVFSRIEKGRRPYNDYETSLVKTMHDLVNGTSETTRETPIKWVKI